MTDTATPEEIWSASFCFQSEADAGSALRDAYEALCVSRSTARVISVLRGGRPYIVIVSKMRLPTVAEAALRHAARRGQITDLHQNEILALWYDYPSS